MLEIYQTKRSSISDEGIHSFPHFLFFLLIFTLWILSFLSADSFSLYVNILFICLLIRGSFNAAVSVGRIIRRRTDEWSGNEGSCRGLVWGTTLKSAWRDWEISQRTESRQTVLGANIWNWDVPKTSTSARLRPWPAFIFLKLWRRRHLVAVFSLRKKGSCQATPTGICAADRGTGTVPLCPYLYFFIHLPPTLYNLSN
jgi:hypothetical protein